MKKAITFIFAALLCVASAHAAKPAAPSLGAAGAGPVIPSGVHGNSLNWSASPDASSTSSVNLYKVSGTCSSSQPTSTAGFTKLQTALPNAGGAVDLAVAAGQVNSYVLTAVIGGVESGPSNCVTATTPTFPPSGLTVTSQ